MTVLSTLQRVCTSIGVSKPDEVFSSTERRYVEIADLANDVAEEIMRAHNWQLLTTLQTEAGDGSTVAFPLPADYDRMLKDDEIWDSSIDSTLHHVLDINTWNGLTVRDFDLVYGAWILFGGNINVTPAPATGTSLTYYYISNLVVTPASGSDKAEFTLDTDEFRLDDRLLKLGVIWRWRAMKGLPYNEDLMNYETLLADIIGNDKGSRGIRVQGRRKMQSDSHSYPRSITP